MEAGKLAEIIAKVIIIGFGIALSYSFLSSDFESHLIRYGISIMILLGFIKIATEKR